MERSRSFGAAAEDYERFRPGYSADLVAMIIDTAQVPIRTAIEIGAGTGKATRMFAAAGVAVTAVEPDPAMLAVLERACAGLPVRPLLGTYEDLDTLLAEDRDARPVAGFDLLFAAAAFHWTRPQRRWDRAAALVRPGGLLAFFGGPLALIDPESVAREDAVLLRHGVDIRVRPQRVTGAPDGGAAGEQLNWPGDELLADDRFTDIRQRHVRRRLIMDRQSYLGHLNTVSAYRMLSSVERATVLAELAGVLPGQVELGADLDLHTAIRVGPAVRVVRERGFRS